MTIEGIGFMVFGRAKRITNRIGWQLLINVTLMQDLFELIVYYCCAKNQSEDIYMIVTKDTIIGDVVMQDEGIAPILMASGLHCLGCALASGETIEEACMVHGMDCDALVEEINNYFQSKG